MADIAASDVTYTLLNSRKINGSPSRKLNRVRLAFGDGALTYPASGIPLTIGKLGCPSVVESLIVVDKGTSGYEFKYDQSAKKLVMFQAPAQTHSHDIFAVGGLTSSEPLLLDASQVFGKNAATNRTIAGANAATTGGVMSATLSAAAMSEPSAVAIAAQTIEVEVIGY
jgi:hypothetical protein